MRNWYFHRDNTFSITTTIRNASGKWRYDLKNKRIELNDGGNSKHVIKLSNTELTMIEDPNGKAESEMPKGAELHFVPENQ